MTGVLGGLGVWDTTFYIQVVVEKHCVMSRVLGDDKGNMWIIKDSGANVVREVGRKGLEVLCDQGAEETGEDRMRFAGS